MLLDTNVWSEVLRPKPNQAVLELLAKLRSELRLSTIVLAELEFGIARASDPSRKKILRDFVDDILIRFADRLIAPDSATALAFGETKARLFAAGTPIADLDLMIAAQAIATGMPLVTRNVADMARTGVTILNPWEP
jgi:toxin FitB